jgi:hypothetical protein
MTPRDRYRAHIKRWAEHREGASARALTISRLRLLSFFAGAILLVAGVRTGAWMVVCGAAGLLAFAYLVVRHARVLAEIERADAALALGSEGLARIARDWNALPDIPAPRDLSIDTHPYARDLDLYGHASLTRWLGVAATRDGTMRLADWLLAPADLEQIAARQAAIEELAPKVHWRERLAIEGRLSRISREELANFLEWAESGASAVPAALRIPAILLPAALIVSLALWWSADLVDPAFWLLPLSINVVLSFAFGKAVFATYDRVAVGERALEGYASMLSLVCDETWQSPELSRLQQLMCGNGGAPGAVKRLARLAEWSQLRGGAPIVHIVVQALTLWDFHLLFALERWRARSGTRVRAWLEALGSVDALAVLSAVRADEPEWTVACLDPAARVLSSTELGHPLMPGQRRVSNDVEIGPPGTMLFVTGSNMSGKSTLLRAIGLNVVLAQAGAPVCAKSFRTPPAALYTSIHVEDSLELGMSYFMAALARLKQIVDAAERSDTKRVLMYLLDEVLQGTNSVERGIAVCAVARHLLNARAIGAMTSHDLALADQDPIKSAGRLVHFTEQVRPDGTMTFDYRLRPGLATSRNAIRLMQLIGIAPE